MRGCPPLPVFFNSKEKEHGLLLCLTCLLPFLCIHGMGWPSFHLCNASILQGLSCLWIFPTAAYIHSDITISWDSVLLCNMPTSAGAGQFNIRLLRRSFNPNCFENHTKMVVVPPPYPLPSIPIHPMKFLCAYRVFQSHIWIQSTHGDKTFPKHPTPPFYVCILRKRIQGLSLPHTGYSLSHFLNIWHSKLPYRYTW